MTPCQQFRLWTRRSPVGERFAAGAAALLAVALVAWLLVPELSDDIEPIEASGTPAATDSPAAAPPDAPMATAVVASPDAPSAIRPTTATTPAATEASGSVGCTSPPGGDEGITDKEIKVAVVLTNLVGPAGNSTFGLPSTDEQKLNYEQVIQDMNAKGGVACRRIVAQYLTVNPADASDRQQKCLMIVDSKPFLVIDSGAYYGSPTANCFPQRKLSFFGSGRLTDAQRDAFYPYVFGLGNWDRAHRDTLFALAQRGFFKPENGFTKLGTIYTNCWPDLTKAFFGWLQELGFESSEVASYDLGCPSGGFASPADLQQAVLKFRTAGVSHVTPFQIYRDFANFTKIAQQQGFTPVYGMAEEIIAISYGNLRPDYDNIAGATIIADDTYGEEHTPGFVPSDATRRCNAIFEAKGRPPVYQQAVGYGGVACGQLWMVQAAVEHAATLQRTALAEGLRSVKRMELSYPYGPADFTAPRATYAGGFWRVVQFLRACSCWRVVDPAFKPSF